MAHLNIEKVLLTSRDREKEIQKRYARKKTIYVLIVQYLEENGCVNTADVLRNECNLNLSDSSTCDNIGLETILQDFESYHFLRYQKLPQVVKKVCGDDLSNRNCKTSRAKSASKRTQFSRKLLYESSELSTKRCSSAVQHNNSDASQHNCDNNKFNNKLPSFFEKFGTEWQQLADIVMQDVGFKNKAVLWSDIVGLERAKDILKEAIIYPVKYNNLFTSDLTPWKSILLYGPTGTGKTSLAAAVATESDATFFNVSASTLVSKWRGESEKLVRVLFELAKQHSPSVIFIDEIDSLMGHRGSDHEASRRMKTEFFSQIDSLFSSDKNVFILVATNIPWELDQAVLRRMEKRLFIPLPDYKNRVLLFKKFLSTKMQLESDIVVESNLDFDQLAASSKNFSATDIELVCREAKMSILRKVFLELENSSSKTKQVCIAKKQTLLMSNLLSAINNSSPSNVNTLENYLNWKEKHGCE